MERGTEGQLLSVLLKLDLLQSSEGARVDFKEPLTKDNWLKFVDTYLKATGLKYKVDTDGDINVRFGNGGNTYKNFDKDFAVLFLQASKLSSKSDDAFVVACLVIGDQRLPAKDKDKITEFLARATFGTRSGSFGIMQDRMVFKVSMLADSKMDGNNLAQALLSSQKMFCSYYNVLPDVLDNTLSVTQAIDKVEKS